ncbi:MAG TPA: hypothetical protein VGN12_15955 [Pirellulales bacterium]
MKVLPDRIDRCIELHINIGRNPFVLYPPLTGGREESKSLERRLNEYIESFQGDFRRWQRDGSRPRGDSSARVEAAQICRQKTDAEMKQCPSSGLFGDSQILSGFRYALPAPPASFIGTPRHEAHIRLEG